MEVRPWPTRRSAAQDLSKAEPFQIGPLMVDPPTRTITANGREETLEPRVMRVFVALTLADGHVLSRDDLIGLCWDGNIVGDNAINRVISRLRAMLADLANNSVCLETITKVGFRLVLAAPQSPVSPAAAPPVELIQVGKATPGGERLPRAGRRAIVAGGLATAALLGLGFRGFVQATQYRPDPKAVLLVERGNTVMKSARLGATPEAIKLFGQAVRIDPDYAVGWGALASSYRHVLDGYGSGERESYPGMVHSAADRALALDPSQPDALIALAAIYPEYRNWFSQERELRALVDRFPEHWYVNARMGILLQQVGRFEDALEFTAKVPRIDAQLAPAWAGLMRTLTNARRFHQADAAYDEAMAHISPHPAVWFTRYSTLLESRRYGEAAAFALDPRTLPEELPGRIVQTYGGIASALANKDTDAMARSVAYVTEATKDAAFVPRGAPLLAILGASDSALNAYTAYLFGGEFNRKSFPAPGPLDLRDTDAVFRPSMVSLRSDPRYAKLLLRSGLEEYWNRSGSQPDFRRS